MGLCYSLRPRLFGHLSGSISNAASDSDQPPDSAPSRTREEHAGESEKAPLRTSQTHPWETGKQLSGEARRGDLNTDSSVIQNGGGKGSGKDRKRLQLLQKHGPQKQKHWDKLLVEEKEAEKEAKKVSKTIDKALKELKREYKQTHRLLLLGKCRICYMTSPPLPN